MPLKCRDRQRSSCAEGVSDEDDTMFAVGARVVGFEDEVGVNGYCVEDWLGAGGNGIPAIASTVDV